MAAPYRSRDGLSTRPVANGANSDEIQLRIDPMNAEFDDEVTGLRNQVRKLRDVAQEIETEAKYQNDFLNQLDKKIFRIPLKLRVTDWKGRKEEEKISNRFDFNVIGGLRNGLL